MPKVFRVWISISECLNRIRNEVVFKSESSITQDIVETNETVLNLIPGESGEKISSGFWLSPQNSSTQAYIFQWYCNVPMPICWIAQDDVGDIVILDTLWDVDDIIITVHMLMPGGKSILFVTNIELSPPKGGTLGYELRFRVEPHKSTMFGS